MSPRAAKRIDKERRGKHKEELTPLCISLNALRLVDISSLSSSCTFSTNFFLFMLNFGRKRQSPRIIAHELIRNERNFTFSSLKSKFSLYYFCPFISTCCSCQGQTGRFLSFISFLPLLCYFPSLPSNRSSCLMLISRPFFHYFPYSPAKLISPFSAEMQPPSNWVIFVGVFFVTRISAEVDLSSRVVHAVNCGESS